MDFPSSSDQLFRTGIEPPRKAPYLSAMPRMIAATGNPSEGFTFLGLFIDADAASQFANRHGIKDWWMWPAPTDDTETTAHTGDSDQWA